MCYSRYTFRSSFRRTRRQSQLAISSAREVDLSISPHPPWSSSEPWDGRTASASTRASMADGDRTVRVYT
jgi:hypothetical protein